VKEIEIPESVNTDDDITVTSHSHTSSTIGVGKILQLTDFLIGCGSMLNLTFLPEIDGFTTTCTISVYCKVY
jgi:hypothetical protein